MQSNKTFAFMQSDLMTHTDFNSAKISLWKERNNYVNIAEHKT